MSVGQDKVAQWDLFVPSWTFDNSVEWPSGRLNINGDISPPPPFEPPTYSISVGPDKALQWDPPVDSDELAIALSYHFPLPRTLEAKMQAAMEKWIIDRKAQHRTPTSLEWTQLNRVDGRITHPPPDPEKPIPKLRHPRGSVSSIRLSISPDNATNSSAISAKSSSPQPSNGNARKRSTEVPNGKLPAIGRQEIPGMMSWQVKTGEFTHHATKKRAYAEQERIRIAKNRGNACGYHRRRKQKCDAMDCHRNKQRLKEDTLPHLPRPSHQVDSLIENSPTNSIQDLNFGGCQDPDFFHASGILTNDLCPDPISLPALPVTPGIPHFKAPFQNIPEARDSVGVRYRSFMDSAAGSQTSNSSSPQPSIFTATNGSSLECLGRQSFSDSSVASLPVKDKHSLFGISDWSGREPPQTLEDDVQLPTMESDEYDSSHPTNTSDRLIAAESLQRSNKDVNTGAQLPTDVDFESFIHSEGFLYSDRNNTSGPNFETTSNCTPPVSINKRKQSSTRIPEPLAIDRECIVASFAPPNMEESEEVKSCDEDPRTATPIANEAYSTTLNCGGWGGSGVGGNNKVIRDHYAPKQPQFPRRFSGRSRYSGSLGNSAANRDSVLGVMRRDSTHSTASQDSRHSFLDRGRSSIRSDGLPEGILRRDSTNSTISQDSQHNGCERGYRHVHHSDRLRKMDPLDTTARVQASCDEDSTTSSRGSYFDDVPIYSDRSRRLPALGYSRRANSFVTQRNVPLEDAYVDHGQTIEHLTLGLGLTHI